MTIKKIQLLPQYSHWLQNPTLPNNGKFDSESLLRSAMKLILLVLLRLTWITKKVHKGKKAYRTKKARRPLMKIGITKCARKDIPIKEKDTLIRRRMLRGACRGAYGSCVPRNVQPDTYPGGIPFDISTEVPKLFFSV